MHERSGGTIPGQAKRGAAVGADECAAETASGQCGRCTEGTSSSPTRSKAFSIIRTRTSAERERNTRGGGRTIRLTKCRTIGSKITDQPNYRSARIKMAQLYLEVKHDKHKFALCYRLIGRFPCAAERKTQSFFH